MTRRWAFALAIPLIFSLGAAPVMAQEVLTLEAALTQAFQNNPTVENARISVESVKDELDAARTRQYPAFNMGLRGNHSFVDESFEFKEGSLGTVGGNAVPSRDIEIDTQNDFTTIFSLEAKQPLVGLYRIGLNIDKIKVQDEIEKQKLRAKRQDTAKRVKEQYYEILETQSALETTQESIAFYRSLVTLVGNKVRVKTALEYQLLDTQAKLAKANHDALKQKNTLLSEKERLNELLGRDVETPFKVTADLRAADSPIDLVDAQAQALKQRPEAREARLKLEQAQTELDIKKSAYLPDVDLKATYTKTANTELIPDENFFVGVVARWEFFDWGRRSDEVSKARLSINQAHNVIRRTDAQVVTDVNTRTRELENAKNLVGVTELAQKAARQKLKVTRNRYAQQSALLDDVLKAQSELADANNDYHKAVLSVWTARANLAKALGEE